jgi:predicted N-acetyltransferase YhbS
MTAKCTIRRARATDVPALARLLSALQAHYASPDPAGGAEKMARLLTRPGDHIPFALIAERDGKAVGLATLTPVLYGGAYEWLLWLKDLYVTEKSGGIGEALMRAMAKVAVDEGYVRIDWTTDQTNSGAQRFYDRLAIPREGKVCYRLSGETLRKFAGR